MNCVKCGSPMEQVDKSTFTGREIREYECRKCGQIDIEDCGVALWQVLHDANEQTKAEESDRRVAGGIPPPKPAEIGHKPAGSLWQRFLALFRACK